MPPDLIALFLDIFPGRAFDFAFPCVRGELFTFILVPASRLDEARQATLKTPLPLPVVPFVMEDVRDYRKPAHKWIRISQKGIEVFDGEARINWWEGVNVFSVGLDRITKICDECV